MLSSRAQTFANQLDALLDAGPLNTSYVSFELGVEAPPYDENRINTIFTDVLPLVRNAPAYVVRLTIDQGYDTTLPPFVGFTPPADNSTAIGPRLPVNIGLQYYLQSLRVENNRLYFKGYLRAGWNDPRLRYNDLIPQQGRPDEVSFPSKSADVWTPDIYFDGASSGWKIFGENGEKESLFVDAFGDIRWSRQAWMDSHCKMNYKSLPYDVQRCTFSIGIYSFDTSQVALQWRSDDPDVAMPGWADSISLPEWSIKAVEPYIHLVVDETLGRNFTYARATLILARNSQYYEQYVVLATILFTMLAWSSFFISRAAAPARVSMTIILFLCVSNQMSSVLHELPVGSDGVWLLDFMTTNAIFIFYAIAEYALCNYLMRLEARVVKAHEKVAKQRAASAADNEDASLAVDLPSPARAVPMSPGVRPPGRIEIVKETSRPAAPTSGTRSSATVARDIAVDLTARAVAAEHYVERQFVGSMQSLKMEVARTAGKLSERFPWILTEDGILRIRAHDVDIFSRWAFPPAYAISLVAFFATI